jgi:hypothetical protein
LSSAFIWFKVFVLSRELVWRGEETNIVRGGISRARALNDPPGNTPCTFQVVHTQTKGSACTLLILLISARTHNELINKSSGRIKLEFPRRTLRFCSAARKSGRMSVTCYIAFVINPCTYVMKFPILFLQLMAQRASCLLSLWWERSWCGWSDKFSPLALRLAGWVSEWAALSDNLMPNIGFIFI